MQLMDEMRSDSTSNDPELPLVPDVSPNEALPVTCDAHSALACLLLNVQLWSQKSATSDSDAGMVQHSEMWFDDGTIIIQAEDTQFRVYKGTLCRVSSVLREQVESMEALKDKNKCPILRLVDSATDVAHVLRAIFDRWYVYLFVSSVAFNALMPFIQVLPRH
jgi:uncharacterized OsmC-like protein